MARSNNNPASSAPGLNAGGDKHMAARARTGRCKLPFKGQLAVLACIALAYIVHSAVYMTNLMHSSDCVIAQDVDNVDIREKQILSAFVEPEAADLTVMTTTTTTTLNPYKADYEQLQELVRAKEADFEDRIRAVRLEADKAQKKAGTPSATKLLTDNTPPFWIESTPDDFLHRTYDNVSHLKALRPPSGRRFFHPVCGLYRFNLTQLPKVSVVITVQNELDHVLPMAVHSILARTPPELLQEIIVVDDNVIEPDEHPPIDNRQNGTESERSEMIRNRDGTDVAKSVQNGMAQQKPISQSERDILDVAKLPKVKVVRNKVREGCARSRLAGARIATAEVLVFVDSHIEMESGTWLQHLLLPIVENPHTLSMQTIDALGDMNGHKYTHPAAASYGKVDKHFTFGYYANRFSQHGRAETPPIREPYETPFGPGSLFAMRKDEFWRLGGYDKGLHIWGGENTELAMKTWMCGGRVIMVPCSRVGHIYRVHIKEVGHWPPQVPQRLIDELNLHRSGKFILRNGRADDFTRVVTRNNMRVMEVWVKGHPAKDEYYKASFGSSDLSKHPEWQQFVKDLDSDPHIQEQVAVRENNKCHDFEWFDKHVYMRLLGVHHPWHPLSLAAETAEKEARAKQNLRGQPKRGQGNSTLVSCGQHRAESCEACPMGHGALWCNGDCEWTFTEKRCDPIDHVSCGRHSAPSCRECPQGNGPSWCNGECKWNSTNSECAMRPSNTHPLYRKLIKQKPFQPVIDQNGDYVNIVMVRTPFRRIIKRAWDLYQQLKNDVLFLGISSFENFPLPPINPFSEKYGPDEYTPLFPGFLHNMRDPEKHFPPNVTHILMAQSDWIEVYPKVTMPKKYDFSYSGSVQEVETNCDGWSSFNKNWTFVLQALDVMCDLNMTGVLFASKKDNYTCTIPDKCKGLITQTPFIKQPQMHSYIRQSRFVFLPQVSDASPRVSAQALSLDTPILMNKHIFGGWKYVNEKTGEFFTDMSDLLPQMRKILDNQDKYSPREWWAANHGAERTARLFTEYVKSNFADLAKLPPNTTKLTPLFT